MLNVEKRRLWGDLIAAFPRGLLRKVERFFTKAYSDRTRDNSFKLKEVDFKWI